MGQRKLNLSALMACTRCNKIQYSIWSHSTYRRRVLSKKKNVLPLKCRNVLMIYFL